MAIEHADFEGVERLAAVTGGATASTFDHPELAVLGECKKIEEVCGVWCVVCTALWRHRGARSGGLDTSCVHDLWCLACLSLSLCMRAYVSVSFMRVCVVCLLGLVLDYLSANTCHFLTG